MVSIPSVLVGGSRRVRVRDLEEFVERLATAEMAHDPDSDERRRRPGERVRRAGGAA